MILFEGVAVVQLSYPLKLVFDILNNSSIVYFLAPRVEEDEIYD